MKRLSFLSAGMFTIGCDHFIVTALLPEIARSLNASVVGVSQGVSAFALSYAFTTAFVAVQLNQQPARRILLVALSVFLAGNLLTIIASSLPLYLLSRALSGMGAGLFSPLAVATGTQLAGEAKRGRALSFLWGANSAGSVLGGPAALWLCDFSGWRLGFVWIIGITLLAMFGVVFLSTAPTMQAPPSFHERMRRLSNHKVLGIIGVTLLTTSLSLGLFTFTATITQESAAPLTQALWAWSVGGLAGAFGIGFLVDRIGNPRLVMGGVLLLLFLSLVLIPLLRDLHGLSLLPFLLWGIASWSTVAPQQMALIRLEPQHKAAVVALNGTAVSLGSVLGASSYALLLESGIAARFLPGIGAAALLLVLGGQFTMLRREALA